jgi:hypothetical protein
MSRRPQPHPFSRVLDGDPRLAEWTARQRDEAALTRLVRAHLPRSIGERVRVTGAQDGVLEIATSAGAIAAALRQRVPALRSTLAREGRPFVDVRVRVQVTGPSLAEEKRARPVFDGRAASPLFDLAEHLADGPLREALRRWSRRARGR